MMCTVAGCCLAEAAHVQTSNGCPIAFGAKERIPSLEEVVQVRLLLLLKPIGQRLFLGGARDARVQQQASPVLALNLAFHQEAFFCRGTLEPNGRALSVRLASAGVAEY